MSILTDRRYLRRGEHLIGQRGVKVVRYHELSAIGAELGDARFFPVRNEPGHRFAGARNQHIVPLLHAGELS